MFDGEVAVQDFEFADLFEGRELAVYVLHGGRDNRLGGGGVACDGNQRGYVGEAVSDQEDVVDERLLFEEAFDAGGVDFFAVGGNDEFFLAARDVVVTFVVAGGDVAGGEPAVVEDGGGGGGVLEIAGEVDGAVEEQLAILFNADSIRGEACRCCRA